MSERRIAWRFRQQEWTPTALPRLMGILNVTPDSFSDGGDFLNVEAAVAQARRLVEDGAAILDIGGESTRPGAEPVSESEERRRVVPVIEALAGQIEVPISIDTTKAAVAAAAIEAGAEIVNDISGLQFDPEMPAVCRDGKVGVICMHIQGTPQTMQQNPHYDHVVDEVRRFFEGRLEELTAVGIPPERIVLDPGIGFGKTAAHNLELFGAVSQFHVLGRPLLIGHSRKRFLKAILGRPVEERLAGTLGVSIALAQLGVDYLRVHDVRAVHDGLLAWRTLLDQAKGLA